MRIIRPLLSKARLTLFTKPECGLCYEAKEQLSGVLKGKSVEYREIDISRPEHKEWFDVYVSREWKVWKDPDCCTNWISQMFDIPVLHIDRDGAKTKKYMHRMPLDEILEDLK